MRGLILWCDLFGVWRQGFGFPPLDKHHSPLSIWGCELPRTLWPVEKDGEWRVRVSEDHALLERPSAHHKLPPLQIATSLWPPCKCVQALSDPGQLRGESYASLWVFDLFDSVHDSTNMEKSHWPSAAKSVARNKTHWGTEEGPKDMYFINSCFFLCGNHVFHFLYVILY